MSESIPKQLELIKQALKGFKHGASIADIIEAAQIDLEMRTIQRRLETLQKQGHVRTEGRSSGMRYFLVEQSPLKQDSPSTQSVVTQIVPLSREGEAIQRSIHLPEQKRTPVGYNIDFLFSYRPNIDSYLSSSEKELLARLGKTASLNQPAGTYAKEVLQRLLIDLSWNSSRLEGNTYSLLDTQRLISFGETADSKSEMEAQMILNHKDAIEFIVQAADEISFNRYTILNLHALLSHNLLPDPAASGRLRSFAVGITKSVYTPLAVPHQIEEMFNVLLKKADEIENPFEQAFFFMVHLPYLQPFDDVNKRVSRIAANIPLNRLNLAPLSFIPDYALGNTKGYSNSFE
jgi:Fic/DOC family